MQKKDEAEQSGMVKDDKEEERVVNRNIEDNIKVPLLRLKRQNQHAEQYMGEVRRFL